MFYASTIKFFSFANIRFFFYMTRFYMFQLGTHVSHLP